MNKELLIQELSGQGVLEYKPLYRAFRAVDRVDFVLPEFKEHSYENYPLPIGLKQTISQPFTVAFMLQLLKPQEGEKVLEIGFGSGWQTALLAHMVGPKGRVIAIERLRDIAERGKENLKKYPTLEKRVHVVLGNGSLGFNEEAPFDKIIASASSDKIPYEWMRQLKPGGKIVAPVGNSIWELEKNIKGKFSAKEHWGFAFVPLVSD